MNALAPRFLLSLLQAMGVGTLASAALLGCGGKVVVDGGGGSTSTTTSPSGCSDPPADTTPLEACLPMEGDTCPSSASSTTQAALIAAAGLCDSATSACCGEMALVSVYCELPPTGTQCCYMLATQMGTGCLGRPLTVAGEVRTAPLGPRTGWGSPALDAPTLDAPTLDAPTRRAVAEGWAHDARMEHASVAAFAELALELLALGAPAHLVRAAHAAMGDEIRHAELSFALAAAHAGVQVGPGPLPIAGALGEVSLVALARAAAREGCVGETVAALIAAEQRDRAVDPTARAALEEIAADEARHAAFSWQLVAWALREGGAPVRVALDEAFAEALAAEEREASVADLVDAPALHAYGRLTPAEMRAVAARARVEVVEPARRALGQIEA